MQQEESRYKYQVALSFAGEDRQYAEELAQLLRTKDITVFYDFYEKANLWGKNLYQHLREIYKEKSQFCVIFLSQTYAKKLWTQHELAAAQCRAFKESKEYILPLRIDETSIPDLINEDVAYIDLKNTPLQEVANLLEEKLRLDSSSVKRLRCLTEPLELGFQSDGYTPSETDKDSPLDQWLDAPRKDYVEEHTKIRSPEELRSTLLDLLSNKFTRSELRSFCFVLLGSGSAFEQIAARKQPNISIDLISHFERRNQIHRLVTFLRKERPDIGF